jgi:hypothetical protein
MHYAALAVCAIPVVGSFMLSTTAAAQQTIVAERPTPAVGDVWRFRRVDGWTKNELGAVEVVLVEAQPERYIFRTTSTPSGETTTVHTTRELNSCRSLRNSTDVVCGGPAKFPMRVGDKTAFDKMPWTNGDGYFSETCEVKAYEPVKVAAGTFDAFRIECAGTFTRLFGGSGSGRVEETFYYAPKVNRVVMSTYTDYRTSGQMFNKFNNELVEFVPKQ